MKINIAIDGPSAAGKSTISDLLAKKYNYVHLDTGAMYRLVAYKAIVNNIDLENEEAIVELIENSKIEMHADGTIYLDGQLIQEEIRSSEISMASSNVSRFLKVRNALVQLQKKICKDKGFVVDGRDVGSVVLKNAEVKFYLTATSNARAKRRLLQSNLPVEQLESLTLEIEKRDNQDMNRKHSPLIICEDAIYIDSSVLSITETVELMSKYIDQKLNV